MLIESNGPLDTESILSTLVRHEIEGLTVTDPLAATHKRIVRLDGEPTRIDLQFIQGGIEVIVVDSCARPDSIEALVGHWFDLNTDINAIDQVLTGHERFSDQVESRPGIRITGSPDPWESAVMIVLGQQVSLGAARTIGARLVAAYGDEQGGLMSFPEPDRVAGEPVDRIRETLRVTGARARTVKAVASLFAEDRGADGDQLAALPGVGPWTVSCFEIRGSLSPDQFPAGDVVLRRAMGRIDEREAERLSSEWSPIRSYAAVRLWTMATAEG